MNPSRKSKARNKKEGGYLLGGSLSHFWLISLSEFVLLVFFMCSSHMDDVMTDFENIMKSSVVFFLSPLFSTLFDLYFS